MVTVEYPVVSVVTWRVVPSVHVIVVIIYPESSTSVSTVTPLVTTMVPSWVSTS
jgi:hypothetical protein